MDEERARDLSKVARVLTRGDDIKGAVEFLRRDEVSVDDLLYVMGQAARHGTTERAEGARQVVQGEIDFRLSQQSGIMVQGLMATLDKLRGQINTSASLARDHDARLEEARREFEAKEGQRERRSIWRTTLLIAVFGFAAALASVLLDRWLGPVQVLERVVGTPSDQVQQH